MVFTRMVICVTACLYSRSKENPAESVPGTDAVISLFEFLGMLLAGFCVASIVLIAVLLFKGWQRQRLQRLNKEYNCKQRNKIKNRN